MAKKDEDRWVDRKKSWARNVFQDHGRSRTALAVLATELGRVRNKKNRNATYEKALSAIIGPFMRMRGWHVKRISLRSLVRKEESVAIPNGKEGHLMLIRLQLAFGSSIDGLYRYEKEVIPAHQIEKSVIGFHEDSEEVIVVKEVTELRYYVVGNVSDELDDSLRTEIAKVVGNKPTIKVVPVTKEYKSGGERSKDANSGNGDFQPYDHESLARQVWGRRRR